MTRPFYDSVLTANNLPEPSLCLLLAILGVEAAERAHRVIGVSGNDAVAASCVGEYDELAGGGRRPGAIGACVVGGGCCLLLDSLAE